MKLVRPGGPAMAFLASLLIFLASLLFLGQGPVLESMRPRVGKPGDEVTLGGRYFGNRDDGSWITLGGVRVDPSLIHAWTPVEIRFSVPEGAGSGGIVVHTSQGGSGRMVFTLEDTIPRIVQAHASSRSARIVQARAERWAPGFPCTLSGSGFGNDPGDAWIDLDGMRLEGDEILSWSDGSITFVLPAGTGPGKIAVADSRGSGMAWMLPPRENPWVVVETSTLQASMTVEIGEVETDGGPARGLVSAYLPSPASNSWQTVVATVSRDALSGPGCFIFTRENPDTDAAVRWTVDLKVRRSLRVPAGGSDPGLPVPEALLSGKAAGPTRLVPSPGAALRRFVADSTRNRTTPLQRMEALFTQVLEIIEPDPEAGFAFGSDVFADRKASPFGYAGLLVACLRESGIPARMVEGLIAGTPAEHRFWVEGLIPGLGWVELDPWEADTVAPADTAMSGMERMFRSAGVRHLALSRGEGNGSVTRNDMNVRTSFQGNTLLGIQGESSGNIVSFGLWVPPVTVRRTGD